MSSPALAGDGGPPCCAAAIRVLEELCVELNRRATMARMESGRLCGELDVRLQVMRLGSPVVVEVLGPWADAATGDCWDAVRIDPAGRVVWRGPGRACGTGDLVRFVEALLHPEPDSAAAAYRPME